MLEDLANMCIDKIALKDNTKLELHSFQLMTELRDTQAGFRMEFSSHKGEQRRSTVDTLEVDSTTVNIQNDNNASQTQGDENDADVVK
jgi:hypothetical protein